MLPGTPPDFNSIATPEVKRAFLGPPSAVEWLPPSTALYKWTNRITGRNGISPWWFFLESKVLLNGTKVDGLKERQEYAKRLGSSDREFHRVRAGVTKQWNPMTLPMAIRLVHGAWGYIGKAAGQLRDANDPDIFLIAGDIQLWVPGLKASDVTQISVLPYLAPR